MGMYLYKIIMLNGLLNNCIHYKMFNILKVSPCESITYILLVPFLVNANVHECCLYDNHHTNVDARVDDAYHQSCHGHNV